jgi:putative hydrolase of HD superfamily
MPQDQIGGALAFLREAEKLKDVLRSGHTSGGRPESVAEHTWRLCLMVLVFADALGDVDIAKLLKLCIVHDLGEALSGDVPAIMQTADTNKAMQERADLEVLTQSLHPAKRDEILALWEEYEAASTPEAVLAKGFDKLETILQHNQGKNPADFDYAFNLTYGVKQTSAHPLLAEIRAILDQETGARAGQ